MSTSLKKKSTPEKKTDNPAISIDKPIEEPTSKKGRKFAFKKIYLAWLVVVVLLLAAAGSGVYYFLQYQKAQQLLKDPTRGAQIETQELVEKVGKLIELPQGEEPTIATVSDISKLKSQQFFAQAQNGDKVLIYTKAKKAVLYRPLTNKIIEFGPVNLGTAAQNSASPAVTPTPQPISVVLRNGTKTVGYASTVERDLKEKAPNITVVTKDNARKNDHTKILIVDLKGDKKEAAQQLVDLLKGEVGKLPEGEREPQNADFLVILGK